MDSAFNSTFTTTPEARDGPGPPYTSPALQANLVLRVLLGMSAILCCWVPAKLLWKNGEFAAAVWCGVIVILNAMYTVNALIWPDDNVNQWWAGYGFCDVQVYLCYALTSVYSNCVFEIMRNLADRVRLSRATALTPAEKRRQRLLSALNIFTVPVVQVALNYLVMSQRYNVSTLIGCTPSFDNSWPYLIFYVLPTPVYTVGAAYFAVLTWKRFRDYEKSTRGTLDSNDSVMTARQQRVRRKLYLMALSILVPFLPVQMLFLALNIAPGLPWTKAYDFGQIHFGPFPAGAVTFTNSALTGFVNTNQNYISVLSAVPVFAMFGTTAEAVKTYRRYLVALGFGRVFPWLDEEPDAALRAGGAKRPSAGLTMSYPASLDRRKISNMSRIKFSLAAHQKTYPTNSSNSSETCRDHDRIAVPSNAREDVNPWPDLALEDEAIYARREGEPYQHRPTRNPWLLRTAPAASTLDFSSAPIQELERGTDTGGGKQPTAITRRPVCPPVSSSQDKPCANGMAREDASVPVPAARDDDRRLTVTFLDEGTVYTCVWWCDECDETDAASTMAVRSASGGGSGGNYGGG